MSFTANAGRLRLHRAWLIALQVAFTVTGFVPTLALMVGHMPFVISAAAPFLYFGGMIACAIAWQRSWKTRHGALLVDENGVFLDGRPVIRRAKLRHGYLLSANGRRYLRLVPRHQLVRRPIDVEVVDAAEANRILAALRLDATTSVVHYDLVSGTRQTEKRRSRIVLAAFLLAVMMSLFLMLVGPITKGPIGALSAVGFVLYCLVSLAMFAAERARVVNVSVGADGVRLRQGMFANRFIPFGEIRDVTLAGQDITFVLADDTAVQMHHPNEGKRSFLLSHSDRTHEGASLVERIRERLEAHRAAPPAPVSLGQSGRSAEEWVRDAGSVREQSATYRRHVVPDEQLWRIVEDAAATPTDRTGAALALRSDLDDNGRARLRIAAGACAAKELRVALESVATTEDDQELARDLEPLEERRTMRGRR